jgi:hypothetical protein
VHWAVIIGGVIAALMLAYNWRQAVSKRQRELRGQLREVLRDVSQACDDYDFADRRESASVRLREASDRLKVIHDEGILSPSPWQMAGLQRWVEAFSGQTHAAANFASMIGTMVPPDEAAHLREGLDYQTERMQRYVAALAAKYRRATAKMDNGHVETYLRYRIIGPFIRR